MIPSGVGVHAARGCGDAGRVSWGLPAAARAHLREAVEGIVITLYRNRLDAHEKLEQPKRP